MYVVQCRRGQFLYLRWSIILVFLSMLIFVSVVVHITDIIGNSTWMRILKKINDYNTDHFLASALTLRLSYIIRSRTEKRLTYHSKPKVTDKKTARSKLPYQKSKQQNQTACNIINRPTNRLQTPDAKIGSSHRYTRESCNKKPARVTPGICQSARSAKEREREKKANTDGGGGRRPILYGGPAHAWNARAKWPSAV